MGIMDTLLMYEMLNGKGRRSRTLLNDDDDPITTFIKMKEFLDKHTKKDEKKDDHHKHKGKYELSFLELSFLLTLCMYVGGFVAYWVILHH